MRNKNTKFQVGKIIHIGKSFKSHDGKLLKNRFMCIFSIEKDDLVLMPMSTFHDEKQKDWKLNHSKEKKTIFEYSEKHGNNRNGYLKSNQLYLLDKNEYDIFDELRICRTMNQERFEELQDYVKNLQKDKVEFLEKRIVFENEMQLNKTIATNNLDEITNQHLKKIVDWNEFERNEKAKKIGDYEPENKVEQEPEIDEYER